MRIFQLVVLTLLLVISYLAFWPTEVTPLAWEAPPNLGYTGDFAVNDKLATVEVTHLACQGCEDVAVDLQGRVYGAAATGDILRFTGDQQEVLAQTDGRPLGLDFDAAGELYIADAVKGLLVYRPTTGTLETLSTSHGERPYRFADDLEVGPDGKVYFSDASDRWDIHHYKYDLLENCPAGRLLVYDPQTGQVDQLLDSLHFANGVATSPDSNFALVNETSRYRVLRYWLRGPQAGTSEVFIDNLPGFPDGISRGADGVYWLALISPRNPIIDKTCAIPSLRKAIARLPAWAQPAPETHVGVIGLDKNGQVVHNFQDPNGKFAQIASIQQVNDDLYLGSLQRAGIGIFRNFRSK